METPERTPRFGNYSAATAYFNKKDQYSAASLTEETNHYLASLLDPKGCGDLAMIPDHNSTPSRPKQVNMAQQLTIVSDGLLLFRPNARSRQVTVWLWSGTRYNYASTLDWDQNIADNYDTYRSVSSVLSAISSTVASGNFDIGGMFNVVTVNILPEVRTLNFNTLSSFKMSPGSVLTSQPVMKGVAVLMNPTGNHDFRKIETDSTYIAKESTLVDLSESIHPNMWVMAAVANGAVLFDTSLETGFSFPTNFWGKGGNKAKAIKQEGGRTG